MKLTSSSLSSSSLPVYQSCKPTVCVRVCVCVSVCVCVYLCSPPLCLCYLNRNSRRKPSEKTSWNCWTSQRLLETWISTNIHRKYTLRHTLTYHKLYMKWDGATVTSLISLRNFVLKPWVWCYEFNPTGCCIKIHSHVDRQLSRQADRQAGVLPVEGVQQVQLCSVCHVDELTLNREEAAVFGTLRRSVRPGGAVEETPHSHLTVARTYRSKFNGSVWPIEIPTWSV